MQIYLQQAKTALKYYLLNLFQIYTVSQLKRRQNSNLLKYNTTRQKKYITITALITIYLTQTV